MSITKKHMAAVAAPIAAAIVLTGVSTPDAFAATASTACSASINPTSDAKITVKTFYTKKTSTTWQHTSRMFYPTSHGFNKKRSDFSIFSYLTDGNSMIAKEKTNKGEARWDLVAWGHDYPAGQRPITKKGRTRIVAQGWYNQNAVAGWPVDCNSKSFAF
ncbi:hypothetical protein [Streptomyces sp. NBC_00078]|uniref:hypothetical protein n=1 Tax=unclassified Streptomyces TaxID=2593676 RepID=UPI00225753CC|nr:hypothetical protein [Streptomyces sp. NBC_00078]MCX5424530.1 hypothetical protein [Streptomyces sp. NBC_00078]